MRFFSLAPALRRNPPPDALIRIFQSEVSEVREDPEPAQLRVTLHMLAGLFVTLLAVAFGMRLSEHLRDLAARAGVEPKLPADMLP